MNNPEVMSHKAFVARNVIQRIHTVMTQPETTINNSTIEACLAELVREQMILLARIGCLDRPQSSLLSEAIKETQSSLQERLDAEFDFEPYFDVVREKMADSAKEIASLQGQLKQAIRQERVGSSRRIEDGDVPFQISEIGLKDALEGMVAIPLLEEGCYLNLMEVRKSYRVGGVKAEEILFPFQIFIDELTFIVDDDGSIFISTSNFPETLIEDARGALEQLGKKIYTRKAWS